MTPRPDFANGTLVNVATISALESQRGFLPNQWFRIERRTPRDELQIGYILVTDKRAGQYVRELPRDVDPQTVRNLPINWRTMPGTDMARGQRDLILALLNDPRKVLGPDDEFVATDSEKAEITNLLPILDGIIAASVPGSDESVLAASKSRIFEGLQSAINNRNILLATKVLVEFADQNLAQHAKFAAPCTIAGWFMIYRDLCDGAVHHFGQMESDGAAALAKPVSFVAYGCAPGISDPVVLMPGLAEKCIQAGLHEIVERIAEQYRATGELLIERSLTADTADQHDDALYQAGLSLFVANRLYSGMSERENLALSEPLRKKYRKFAEVAEESQVRVMTALLNALRNRAGEMLKLHRARISAAREKGGEKAVKDELFELIDRQYLYPRSYEKILLDADIVDPDSFA